jgi:predicted membrane metal-binding protein
VFQIIISILGIAASAIYVGYLAFSIHSVPLWVIVVATFALMIREFVIESRESRSRGNRTGRSG